MHEGCRRIGICQNGWPGFGRTPIEHSSEEYAQNAADFDGYAAVFYFYNPFGKPVFEKVIQRLIESQNKRDRDIWAVYYSKRTIKPVDSGFIVGLLRRLVQKR